MKLHCCVPILGVLLFGLLVSSQDPRIVGGYATSNKEVPYLIYLRQYGRFICGGSIISRLYVLTAAHCVKGAAPRSLTVHAGATYLSDRGAISRDVLKYAVPRQYNGNSLTRDAAVLRLRSRLPDSVTVIKLSYYHLQAGDEVLVSGWGLRRETATSVPNRVRAVRVPLISKKECMRRYKGRARLSNSMICALEAGKDSCSGDSGGPMVHRNRLHGIVSWGIGCARRNSPGVYTLVRHMATFIERSTQKLSK